MSDSVWPRRRQPTRRPRPWDSPGKNTGVGCPFLLQCLKVKSESEVAQSYPTIHDPMDCSLPGSSVHGIFQARVQEWGAIAFSWLYTGSLYTYSQESWWVSAEPCISSLQKECYQFPSLFEEGPNSPGTPRLSSSSLSLSLFVWSCAFLWWNPPFCHLKLTVRAKMLKMLILEAAEKE